MKSWEVIFLGRLVFGFGGESLSVANSALVADWFRGRELAFAFGVNLAVAKLGSVINNIVSPYLAQKLDVQMSLWFGTIVCIISLACVVMVMPIDRHMDMKMGLHLEGLSTTDIETMRRTNSKASATSGVSTRKHSRNNSKSRRPSNELTTRLINDAESYSGYDDGLGNGDDAESVVNDVAHIGDVLEFKQIFWVLVLSCVVVYGSVLPFNNVSSSLLQEKYYFMEPPSQCALTIPTQCESSTNVPNMYCPSSQWYQPPLPYNVTVDGTYYPDTLTAGDIKCDDSVWKNGCTHEYCVRLEDGEKKASVMMSIPYIISACASPFLGLIVDKYGCRAIVATVAPIILVIVHALFAFSMANPIIPLVGQGIAYTAFASVLWPAIPIVVPERLTGLAFGVVTSMQNLTCALVPLIVAYIYTLSGNRYIPNVEIMFITFGVLGSLVGVYLNFYDYNHDSVLNKPDTTTQQEEADAYSAPADSSGTPSPHKI
jgi:MFS family permease